MRPGRRVLGRFLLGEFIGRGGLGTVWEARDEQLEEWIALKFILPQYNSNPASLHDLKKETIRTRRLTHPHIIRIHDMVSDQTHTAIAMELVTRHTLPDGTRAASDLAARKLATPHGCFEPAELEAWVRQLASALTYAHKEARIVHRDLKPANLLIDAANRIKVADFGIARSLVDTQTQKRTAGEIVGTLAYMSPQQLKGAQPNESDDIYSFGATLYDLITGKPPFYSGDLYGQVINLAPPSLAERRKEFGHPDPAVPKAWEQMIQSCLAKEAAGRPKSVAEAVRALGLHESPPEVGKIDLDQTQRLERPAPPPAPSSEAPAAKNIPTHAPAPVEVVRPRRWQTGVMVAGILLIAAGGGFWLSRSTGPKTEASREPAAVKFPSPIKLSPGARFVGDALRSDGLALPFALVFDAVDAEKQTVRGRLGDTTPESAARTFSGSLKGEPGSGRWQVTVVTTEREAQPTGGPFSQAQEGWTIQASLEADGTLQGASETTKYRLQPQPAAAPARSPTGP